MQETLLCRLRKQLDERGLGGLLAADRETLCYLLETETPPTSTALYIPATNEPPHVLMHGETADRFLQSGKVIGIDLTARALFATDWPEEALVSAAPIIAAARRIKTRREIDLLSRASVVADLVMQEVMVILRPGITEQEMASFIDARLSAYGITSTYFPTIVAAGPGSGEADHKSGAYRLRIGDSVTIDFGGPLQGYCCDLTRTFVLGPSPSPEFRCIYELVREAQECAFAAVRVGIPAGEVDAAARRVIEARGYGWAFPHDTGHGIGREGHEEPIIGPGVEERLEEGMVFSLEPGIYLPGRCGVRIEDLVVVEYGGARRLNSLSRDLHCLGC